MQAPPNLVDLEECRALLGAGVDDWGGVSPLTPDHVNPERPWPSPGPAARDHRRLPASSSRARLTVHPEYVSRGEPWLDPRVSAHVAALADDDGLARDRRTPHRAALAGARRRLRQRRRTGRTDLHAAVDTEGRTDDRRSDFDDVYGDWDALKDGRRRAGVPDRIGRRHVSD